MTPDRTTFTVAIPTHDRRDTVVLAALSASRQTRPPEEVLVLCDGCTDGTADAIAGLGDPRIRAIELTKGPGYAYAHRNVAVREGIGDVVMWLGDDDLYLPDHLERIGRIWDQGGADLVTTPAVIVHEDDRLEWIGRDLRLAEHRFAMVHEGNTAVMGAVSVRRTLVGDAGGWDGTLPRAADWELWKRMLARGARPGWQDEPTLLHFRATSRRQAWPERVAQNRRWAALLGGPSELDRIREELRATRSAWEAALTDEIRRLRDDALEVRRDAERAHAAAAELHARLKAEVDAAATLHRTIAELTGADAPE